MNSGKKSAVQCIENRFPQEEKTLIHLLEKGAGGINMVKTLSGRLITEPARQTRVCREADVVVVGGGPGGASGAGIFHFSCKQNGKTSC
jgi:hypothetical protein